MPQILEPFQEPGPLQICNRALRRDDLARTGLNAIHRRTNTRMTDIVLLICLETYLPELGMTLHGSQISTDTQGQQLSVLLMDALRRRKRREGVSLARSVLQAVVEWITRNVGDEGRYGEAVWVHEMPPGLRAPHEKTAAERNAADALRPDPQTFTAFELGQMSREELEAAEKDAPPRYVPPEGPTDEEFKAQTIAQLAHGPKQWPTDED